MRAAYRQAVARNAEELAVMEALDNAHFGKLRLEGERRDAIIARQQVERQQLEEEHQRLIDELVQPQFEELDYELDDPDQGW
jgi:hypothetical protein